MTESEPREDSARIDLALLRLVASGMVAPDRPGVSDLVRDGYVELRERRISGGGRSLWPFLTTSGLGVLRAAREPRPQPTFGKGRNVLYVPAPHKERAAIIVDTHPYGTANLLVFPTDPQDERLIGHGVPCAFGVFVVNAHHSQDLSKVGTWHWLGEGHTRPLPKGA